MLRKVAMFLSCAMLVMPFGGDGAVALGKYVHVPEVAANPCASWWLGPEQIILVAACVLVLSLTACRRWQ